MIKDFTPSVKENMTLLVTNVPLRAVKQFRFNLASPYKNLNKHIMKQLSEVNISSKRFLKFSFALFRISRNVIRHCVLWSVNLFVPQL